MTMKWWCLVVLLVPFSSSSAAFVAPEEPSSVPPKQPQPAPTDPKPPPKGAPGSANAGPPIGLSFEYVTPSDFVTPGNWRDPILQAQGSPGYVLGLKPFTGNELQNAAGGHYTAEALARVRLPQGARIRWFDCALQGGGWGYSPSPGVFYGNGTLSATATLLHARYIDDANTAPPYSLAVVKMSVKSGQPQGMGTLSNGATVDHARGSVNGDGWYYVNLKLELAGAINGLGLRACRVGYAL